MLSPNPVESGTTLVSYHPLVLALLCFWIANHSNRPLAFPLDVIGVPSDRLPIICLELCVHGVALRTVTGVITLPPDALDHMDPLAGLKRAKHLARYFP